MGIFDSVNTSKTVTADKDQVKGQKRESLASDIYNLIIKYAYVTKAKSGAMAVNLVLTTQGDREIKMTEYITSGDAKGNKTYYEKEKDGKKEQFNLPGFSLIDALAQIVTGKSILEASSEKRAIKLYDFETKTEKPTEVDMLVDLVGKPICGAVLNQIQDKTAKNAATGEYEATGKVYSTNVVDKFLDPVERKTSSEIKNGIPADFADKWLAKWKGQVDDQSTEVKGAGLKGAPVASGDAAPKTSLFG
jgi:hypothetical protein